MDSSDFLELLRALTHLSSTQLERAQQHIQHHLQADLLRQSFSEHHADEPISCPHCQCSFDPLGAISRLTSLSL